MCTVSIISIPGGLRAVVNRDEERDRPPALPPRWHALPSGRRAIWPIDPLAGGTWVAAADHGLLLCLLNGNPEPPVPRPSADRVRSRGTIIPALIDAASPRAALDLAQTLDLTRFPPFRLVAAAAGTVLSLEWTGTRALAAAHDPRACCFASSGLGDRCVSVRYPLFDSHVAAAPSALTQDQFHLHRWPERPELSVLMSRAAARTVSITQIELSDAGARMNYRPIAEPAQVPREKIRAR